MIAAELPSSQRVIVAGLPSDAHTWNLIFLQLLLEEVGYTVRNLGCCVPTAFLVAQCVIYRPHLILLSSLNGHASMDGPMVVGAIRKCPELLNVPVVIGGKLGTTELKEPAIQRVLLQAGFSAAFIGDHQIEDFIAYLGTASGLLTAASTV